MEKRHHRIDDLFRQGLTNLEVSPTEKGRSAFLLKAGREVKKRSARGWIFPTLGLIIGAGILVGAYLLIPAGKEKNASSPAAKQQAMMDRPNPAIKNIPAASVDKKESKATGLVSSEKRDKTLNVLNQRQSASNLSQSARTKKPDGTQKPVFSNIQTSQPPSMSGTGEIPGKPAVTTQPESFTEDHPSDKPANILASTPEKQKDPEQIPEQRVDERKDSVFVPAIPSKKKVTKDDLTNRPWDIRAGIYYTPEWIHNTLDKNKYVNNFGIEGIFRFGNYSVRTGLGLSITRGFNEIVIDTKPYLGGYSQLDHITYAWDEKHYHLVPTVYTNWKEVFDTVLHTKYYSREKEHTYLQIPLILGYDFYNNKWISLGARGGAVMSVLLKTRDLTSAYDAGKDMVVTVNNVTPDRIHLNWQGMGGINASFRLSRLFIFELEPNVRYYFDSVYEKSGSSDKPWSVGFRAAILINF
jgi:hypothetical protein